MVEIYDQYIDQLKSCIRTMLRNRKISDPVMLADYIVVLVKNNAENDAEAKAYCIEQLMDFLEENTESFVNELFDSLDSKQYMNITQNEIDAELNSDDNTNEVVGYSNENDSEAINGARSSTELNDSWEPNELDRSNSFDRHQDDSGDEDDDSLHRRKRRMSSPISRDIDRDSDFGNESRNSDGIIGNRQQGGYNQTGRNQHGRGGYDSQNKRPRGFPSNYSGDYGGRMNMNEQGGGRGRGFNRMPPGYPTSFGAYNSYGGYNVHTGQFNGPPNGTIPNSMAILQQQQEQIRMLSGMAPPVPMGAPPPPPPGKPPGNPPGSAPENPDPSQNQSGNFLGQGKMHAPPPARPPYPPQGWGMPMPAAGVPYPQQRQQGYFNPNQPQNKRNNNFNPHGHGNHNSMKLADHEKCTIKCTGVPSYVSEYELMAHFRSFGKLVSTRSVTGENSSNSSKEEDEIQEDGKTERKYSTYYAQYTNAEDAKKCFTSAKAVLNNRFIKLFYNPMNLIEINDSPESVTYVTQLVEGKEKDFEALKTQYEQKKQQSNKNQAGANGVGSTGSQGMPASGVPLRNKQWKAPSAGANGMSQSSGTAGKSAKGQQRAEDFQMKYQQLQVLKQKAEEIFKQKEKLINTQLEQYRAMLFKIQGKSEFDLKAQALAESCEVKIMSLQQQLRELQEQHSVDKSKQLENGSTSDIVSVGANQGSASGESGVDSAKLTAPIHVVHPDRFSGGRGRGRFGQGRGSGRGGRWYGGTTNTVDFRPTTLLLKNIPNSLDDSTLQQHFGKYGQVKRCHSIPSDGASSMNSHQYVVEFNSRKEAEIAFNHGKILTNSDNNQIPLEFSWHSMDPSVVGASAPSAGVVTSAKV